MTSPYRAYDIRGLYPSEVNDELVKKVVLTLIKYFFDKGEIVVGHDPRHGSEEMYNVAIECLEANERIVHKVGLMTTPMLTFLVHDLHAGGGIMITASHNPKEYNGIKMIDGDAKQISGEDVYKKLKN